MAVNYGFWEDNLHGTTDRMNACLVLWGLRSEFPAASEALKGRMGIATDEGKVYYDNGSDWVDFAYVKMAGAQTIAGVKTFSSIPVLPASNPTAANEAVRKAYADLFVKLTGNQTVEGVKTFSSRPVIVDGEAVKFKSGTYVGTGEGPRQITTGFLCKYVVIYGEWKDFGQQLKSQWASVTTDGAMCCFHPNGVDYTTGVSLHASDGFNVGGGASEANADEKTYTYVAFG